MKKNVFLAIVFIIISVFAKAQTTAKYYFGNGGLSQNLTVKFLPKGKINFVYTIKEKNNKGKMVTIIYKGIAIADTQGDIESDEDIAGDSYDIFEYKYKLKNCQIYFRIAEDKSKCKIKSGDCPSNVSVSSFDTMIKL